jgi:hypothetical protein
VLATREDEGGKRGGGYLGRRGASRSGDLGVGGQRRRRGGRRGREPSRRSRWEGDGRSEPRTRRGGGGEPATAPIELGFGEFGSDSDFNRTGRIGSMGGRDTSQRQPAPTSGGLGWAGLSFFK